MAGTDAAFDPFTQTIMAILAGSPAIRAAIGKSQGDGAPVVPAREAVPADDGSDLPGGTFTPQRQDPAPAPMPAHNVEQGPLGRMLGLSPETSAFFRRAGAGMSSIRGNAFGDPFITAAQGFGGAQNQAYEEQQAADAAALKASDTAYERNRQQQQDARAAANDAANLKYRELADKRAERTANLTNQKTALEIKRMARNHGITDAQMLEVERIAQAAGENLSGDKRQKAIDETRQRLLDQLQAGDGITGAGSGVSGTYTATNPDTGQTIEWKDGQWVDQSTGEPVQ